jgi:hypothetical protein
MLQNISLYFQWPTTPPGNSMQHDRDMDDQQIRATMVALLPPNPID